MARKGPTPTSSPEQVISIVGPGLRIVGDCDTTDTIRIEGHIEGSVRAHKAVVIGKAGRVNGDIHTQDAVIAGTVKGSLIVESRLELQATCHIDGEISSARLQLEEGGIVNGTISVGRKDAGVAIDPGAAPGADRPKHAGTGQGKKVLGVGGKVKV